VIGSEWGWLLAGKKKGGGEIAKRLWRKSIGEKHLEEKGNRNVPTIQRHIPEDKKKKLALQSEVLLQSPTWRKEEIDR